MTVSSYIINLVWLQTPVLHFHYELGFFSHISVNIFGALFETLNSACEHTKLLRSHTCTVLLPYQFQVLGLLSLS